MLVPIDFSLYGYSHPFLDLGSVFSFLSDEHLLFCVLKGYEVKSGVFPNIKTVEHQILVEADFLVNLYEDAVPVSGILAAYHKIFKTKTGKQLCQTMFASAFPQ